MNDPTYNKAQIDAKPAWKIAFVISECLNDNAPLGWGRYIWVAEAILRSANETKPHLKRKPKK